MRPHQHVDGVSLLPVMDGEGALDREAIHWHYPHYNQHPQSFPSSVIREGRWKLIESLETGTLELYDLEADLGETNDLAESHSAKAMELLSKLRHWRSEVGADPMRPNPRAGR